MGTPSIATSLSVAHKTHSTHARHGMAQVSPAARSPRPMRRFQMAYLRPDGTPDRTEQIAPATPIFDSAFSAFSHGTLLHTPSGQVAVQDLEPGMSVSTADHGPSRVLWIGCITLVPSAAGLDRSACSLTRVMPDTFGLGRPELNLTAGPGARILSRPPGLRDSFARDRVLTPVSDLVDGMNVVAVVPPGPVTVYHLCLGRHAILRASGIEVESFHPGPGFERAMGPNMLALFLSLFPHVNDPADFGSICHPRLPLHGLTS